MNPIFRLIPLLTGCLAILSACGGGGGGSALTTVNPPVAGTISGLGSVIVNGVRYETIGASVIDADDSHTISTPLGLGMTVSIDPLTSSATTAGTIYIQTGIKGGTSAVDTTAKTLNVAGLPVTTDSATFIVTSAGQAGSFADLADNLNVEVYGLPQTDGTFKATRIEIEATAQVVQLVGTVSNLNTANKTFTLGSGSNTVTIAYSGITVPTGLVNGSVVSVHTATTATASQYTATSLYLRSTNVSTFTQYAANYGGTSGVYNEANELYGMVSGLTEAPYTNGCSMQVQGVPTTLRSATLCASLQNGDYVEVKGLLTDGTLAAYRLEFKTAGGDRSLNNYFDDENDDRERDEFKYRRQYNSQTSGSYYSSDSRSSYEIYGTLSACSGSTCTLTSNGSVLTADVSTAFWEHGQVTSGFVEAKGYMTTGNTFKVTKIEAKY
ncbi:MAG: hypothetical protein E6Q49_00425 [Limnohabitans sp.]|nr:MAG: hypothetical protein E6Q49_00425 [Limnohabitans sp.]